MIWLVLIIFGLCLGSFVNALVWRLSEQAQIGEKTGDGRQPSAADQKRLDGLSISKGRSMCSRCGHALAVNDLIPVVSWLALRGKCRYCHQPIADTPLPEVVLPLLFVGSYFSWPWALQTGLGWAAFVAWLLCLVLFVALTMYDFRWFILPDRIVLPLIGLAAVTRLLLALGAGSSSAGQLLLGGVLGAVIIAGLFWGLYLLSEGTWIGGGDVKLAVALGLLVGGPINALLVMLLSSVLGLVSAAPALASGRAGANTKIPFGPFLIAATILVMVFGHSIAAWYLGLLGV